jgi:hypothetical protein
VEPPSLAASGSACDYRQSSHDSNDYPITPITPGSIAPIRDSVPLRLLNVLGPSLMIADGIRLRVRIETGSTEIDSLASRY